MRLQGLCPRPQAGPFDAGARGHPGAMTASCYSCAVKEMLWFLLVLVQGCSSWGFLLPPWLQARLPLPFFTAMPAAHLCSPAVFPLAFCQLSCLARSRWRGGRQRLACTSHYSSLPTPHPPFPNPLNFQGFLTSTGSAFQSMETNRKDGGWHFTGISSVFKLLVNLNLSQTVIICISPLGSHFL